MPDLVTGAVNIELPRAAADLREVGDIEDDPNTGNQIGEQSRGYEVSRALLQQVFLQSEGT